MHLSLREIIETQVSMDLEGEAPVGYALAKVLPGAVIGLRIGTGEGQGNWAQGCEDNERNGRADAETKPKGKSHCEAKQVQGTWDRTGRIGKSNARDY